VTLSHDAAVVTLAGSTPLAGTTAQPIDFLTDSSWTPPAPTETQAAVVSGWGRIEGGSFPTELRWAAMPFSTDSSCQSKWASEGADTSLMVCAGTPGTDSCFGDSGGALATNYDDPIQHITYRSRARSVRRAAAVRRRSAAPRRSGRRSRAARAAGPEAM
jgi:secreted trypsin-like serine protease